MKITVLRKFDWGTLNTETWKHGDQNQKGDQNQEEDKKKVTQPLGTKKITQPLGTKKNHATYWYKKNHTTSWGKKCPKNSILVTNKIQEIGTGHLGLVQIQRQPEQATRDLVRVKLDAGYKGNQAKLRIL